jgi:DNA-binding response OmpR family regulator
MANILIVEDEEDSRELLRTVITLDGHTVIECASAEEVDDTRFIKKPDLAIVDINLPREHGVSLAWRLRKRWPKLKIMVVSAALPLWETDDLRDCGIDHFFPKPYELSELRQKISEVLKGK